MSLPEEAAEGPWATIGPLAVYAVLGVLLVIAILRLRRRGRNLRKVAKRFEGRPGPDPIADFSFVRSGVFAAVATRARSQYVVPYTRIWFHFRPPVTLLAEREGLVEVFAKAFGTEDIQTGDSDFDRQFLVRGEPAPTVLETLNEEIRVRLLRMAGLGLTLRDRGGVSVYAGPRGVLISCARDLARSEADLFAFVDEGLGIQLHLQTLMGGKTAFSSSPCPRFGACPVCSVSIYDPCGICGREGTRHKADCPPSRGGSVPG